MRPQKRSRGRNGGGNPYHNNQNRGPRPQHRSQTFDSNGPNVKIRGNAYQVYERYLGLAREAQSAGDRIAAENFFQHAEHYFRVMSAQGEGFQQRQQHQQQMAPDGEMMVNGEGEQPDEQQGYDRQPQPYDRPPGQQNQHGHQGNRDHQAHDDPSGDGHQTHDDRRGRDDHQPHQQAQVQIRQAPPPPPEPPEDDDQLPSFITGRPE